MKLVIKPLTIIGRAIRSVVKDASTCHLVFLKVTLIIGSILEYKFPLAMFATMQSSTFISPSILISFNSEYHLVLFP